MRNTFIRYALTAVIVSPLWLSADTIPLEKSIVLVRTGAVEKSILERGRPRGPREIPTPKFVVKTRDNSFLLTIGGKINVIAGADLGNNLYNTDGGGLSFATQAIPVPAREGHKADYFINPLKSQIDFQVVGFGNTDNQLTAYLRICAHDKDAHLKLSRAYIQWRGFLAGQQSTVMQDGMDGANMLEPHGPSGAIDNAPFQLSYHSPLISGFSFAAALEVPSWNSSDGVYRGKDYPTFDGKQVADYADAEQMVPDIPLYVQYESGNNKIRLTGLLRDFTYRDLVTNRRRHTTGWAVALMGKLQPASRLAIYYQMIYGAGIGSYMADISGLPISYIPESTCPGRMKATPMMGYNLGVTVDLGKGWQFNAVGSQSRLWGASVYCMAGDDTQNYKYTLYAAANVIRQITPYLRWGVEYVWGRRQTWSIGGANDSRLQTQILFTF